MIKQPSWRGNDVAHRHFSQVNTRTMARQLFAQNEHPAHTPSGVGSEPQVTLWRIARLPPGSYTAICAFARTCKAEAFFLTFQGQ